MVTPLTLTPLTTTQAVSRSGTSPFYRVTYSPYGADNTGASDSTSAIQTAINDAADAGGGVVWLDAGTYKHTGLTLKNRVQLEGEGMLSTTLYLADGSNTSSIINYVSSDNVEANALFTAVRNLRVHGNKDNQSGTSHGIKFNTSPSSGSQATNDLDFDSHHDVENVMVYKALTDGFNGGGRSETKLRKVHAYYCGRYGFTIGFDTHASLCTAGQNGQAGFYTNANSIMLSACKSFYSGQATASAGYGFFCDTNAYNVSMVGCVAQDNKAHGFELNTCEQIHMSGCQADSNSTSSAGTYCAIDMWNVVDSIIDCVCTDRFVGSATTQRNALQIRSNSLRNQIRISHNSRDGSTVRAAILAGSSTTGNDITINNSRGQQSVAYAASITPDPYAGGTIIVGTLTGDLTINAPQAGKGQSWGGTLPEGHVGSRLRFVFTQDGSGAHAVTFPANFKKNWTPDTAASKINTIEFEYDGTNWYQIGATVGI